MNRLDICNLALGRCGAGSQNVLASYEEDTEAGRNCRRIFPYALRSVAADGFWPFLLASAPATLQATPVGTYGYRYAYPADAARVYAIGPAGAGFDRASMDARTSEYARNGGSLSSDYPDAVVWYARMPDPDYDITDHGFCDAVAWLMARELALAYKADSRIAQFAQTSFLQALGEARADALNEGRAGLPGLPRLLASR